MYLRLVLQHCDSVANFCKLSFFSIAVQLLFFFENRVTFLILTLEWAYAVRNNECRPFSHRHPRQTALLEIHEQCKYHDDQYSFVARPFSEPLQSVPESETYSTVRIARCEWTWISINLLCIDNSRRLIQKMNMKSHWQSKKRRS